MNLGELFRNLCNSFHADHALLSPLVFRLAAGMSPPSRISFLGQIRAASRCGLGGMAKGGCNHQTCRGHIQPRSTKQRTKTKPSKTSQTPKHPQLSPTAPPIKPKQNRAPTGGLLSLKQVHSPLILNPNALQTEAKPSTAC